MMKNKKVIIAVAAVISIIMVILILINVRKGISEKTDTYTSPQLKESTEASGDNGETESVTVSEESDETESVTAPEESGETERVTAPEENNETIRETASAQSPEYEITLECVNSWKSNGRYCMQYSGKITNNSAYTINSWKGEYVLPDGCEITSSWNGTCLISGNVLTVTPCEWNSVIPAGTGAEICGFILESNVETGKLVYTGSISGTEQPEMPAETVTDSTTESPYTPPATESGTPFENHGKLMLSGTDLTDCNGDAYCLKGVSTFGLQWMPQYVNKDTFKYLRDGWGANMIRLAMYTAEGGYCSGASAAEALEAVVDRGVNACTELGMYVIIDWHILSDGNPNTYKEQAKAFFAKMSSRYAEYGNVIYEICNEPNGTGWDEIKKYADEIIPVIRANDKDAIIIVGTPTWSQDADVVAANPLNEGNRRNVMYAVHFYAATHGDNIRNKVIQAISSGTPVFISEFSICDASGNGGIDYDSAEKWKQLMKQYNLSYAGWNLGNKNESSAIIKAGVDKLYGWSDSEISDTGKWLRNLISGQ